MKKSFLILFASALSSFAMAQCNGEFALTSNQAFQKFTNGSQIQMTYCGDKSNLHAVMNQSNAYRDNLKLEIENDAKNPELYHIVLTIKENNSGQYASKLLTAIGIQTIYSEGKKLSIEEASSLFK